MAIFRVKYSLIFPLILIPVLLFGQNGMLKNFLTVEDGLSHNEVTSIVQDKDGFIWIGTRGGLNRYDGYEFKIFNQVPGDSNSLVNPSIESLFVDSKGNIWIGTKSGGISRFDPDKEIFDNIINNLHYQNEILPDNRILSFAEDKMGRIWFGTWSNGVIMYDYINDSVRYFLDNEQVNCVTVSSDGRIWVVSNATGLQEYLPDSEQFVNRSTGNWTGNRIVEDTKRNVLWIAGNNLLKYELGNGKITSYDLACYSIYVDSSDRIWAGNWGFGLYIFDPEKETSKEIKIYPERNYNLNKDYQVILDIFEDRDKNIWIGTNGGGVCILTSKLEFQSVGFNPESNKGLFNTRVMSVVDDRSGNLWIGTIGNGLIWSPDRENYYSVSYPENVFQDSYFVIKYIYEDTNGKIWIGSNYGTFNIKFERNIPELVNTQAIYKTFPQRIQAVSFLDEQNIFFVGTLLDGLFVLDKNKNYENKKHIIQNDSKSGSLKNERVSYLLQDLKNRIWVGTYNGLYVYNFSDSTVQEAEEYYSIEGEFTGNIITCMDNDQFGNVWVGTPNGLNRLSETGNNRFKITYYTEKDGLASNFIKGISHDSYGNIWVSTNTGISKLIIDNESFINYNEMDGVRGRDFTEASVYRNHKGELFFGGTYGLTFFKPEEITVQPTGRNPVYTGLKVFNQPVIVNQKFDSKIILNKAIQHAEKIVLPYRFNNFEIHFSALDFKSMGTNKYKYLLENHDKEWIYIGERKFINFNNLKPGEYRLKVKSSNNHNVWNESAAELIIKVLPPFWQTWYALLFYILLVTGIVTIIRWNAVRQVRLANSLEMEKLQHAQDQKISEMKFQFFTNISHEFRTPLTLILAPLKEILNKESVHKLPEDVSAKIHIVHKNAARLMKLVNQLLDFRKAESGNMKLAARNADIEAFIKEVCHPFYELAKINEIDFTFNSNLVSKSVWFDPEKLEIVINNLISNGFKFTKQKGKIEVSLYEEEEEILISVSDNGPGIPSTEIKHIFDRFYRVERVDNYGSSGIGLALVKRFVELHYGHIDVTSEPNVNTEFVISLPKGSVHLKPEEMILTENIPFRNIKNEQFLSAIMPKRKQILKNAQCILIVEDDEEVNQYLEDLLGAHYKIETAFDGLEGFRKAVEVEPDLILSDVMMPKMDGFELCQKIKSNDKLATIPVILLTAKNADNIKLLGAQTGADEFISKPFDPNYLVEKIRNLLINKQKLQKQYSKSVRLEPSNLEITHAEEVFIEKAIFIIEANMQNTDFTSEILASELNMSNSSLYRKLKELTGSSTAEFIRSIRIKRAGQLLADKEKTITEIAFDVGFNDIKHFRTVFQKHFGCSPSEFRQKL